MLRELAAGVHVLPGTTNLGLLDLPGEGVLAIDSGLDETAGRRLLRALDEHGQPLLALLNTHSHADHTGGNAFLVRRTGCQVAAPAAEASLLRSPAWEPVYLFGGARPPAVLRSKFLMAPPSPVHLLLEPGPADLFGLSLELVSLPGHSPGQLGVRAGDVLFTADAFFDPAVLAKHRLPYFAAVGEALDSLARIGRLGARLVVPSHGEPATDPSPAIAANRLAIHDGLKAVSKVLAGRGMTTEAVVAAVLQRSAIDCHDPGHYHLLRAAILACLAHLADAGELETGIRDNLPYWEVKRRS